MVRIETPYSPLAPRWYLTVLPQHLIKYTRVVRPLTTGYLNWSLYGHPSTVFFFFVKKDNKKFHLKNVTIPLQMVFFFCWPGLRTLSFKNRLLNHHPSADNPNESWTKDSTKTAPQQSSSSAGSQKDARVISNGTCHSSTVHVRSFLVFGPSENNLNEWAKSIAYRVAFNRCAR